MRKNIHIKLLAILLVVAMLLSLTSCVFDEWGEDIADSIVGEFDTSKNDPTPTGKPGVNEQILYETVLLESILEEKIITEDILKEQGEISIECQYCDKKYKYNKADVDALFGGENNG